MEITLTPPATATTPPKVIRPAYPTIAQSWGVLGWFLLINLLVGAPAYILLDKLLHVDKLVNQMVLSVLVSIVLLLVLRRKAGKQEPWLHLHGQAKPWMYAALPLLIITSGALNSTLVEVLHLPNWLEASFHDLAKKPLLGLFFLCISAPVLEELVFRGIVLNGLLRNYRPWVAIGQSALLFGLIHLNPAQVLGAGLLGVLLGWLYYRTRSLQLCIAAHAFNNLLAFFALQATLGKKQSMHDVFGSTIVLALVLLGSAAVLALLLWQVHKATAINHEPAFADAPAAAVTIAATERAV